MRRREKLVRLAAIAALALAPSAASADVALDPSFGSNGVVLVDADMFMGGEPEVTGVFRLANGQTTVAGYDIGAAPSSAALLQIADSGTIHLPFGLNGTTVIDFGSVTQAFGFDRYEGIVLMSGAYDDGAGDVGAFVGKYDADGNPYADFSGDGLAVDTEDDVTYTATLVDDGNGVIAFGYDSGDETSFVVRYGGDGSIDTGFGTGGVLNLGDGRVRAAAIDAGGRVVAVGEGPSDESFAKVWAFSQMGVLDASFGVAGVTQVAFAAATSPRGRAIAFSPNGDIAIGGSRGLTELVTPRYGFIIVFDENGDLKTSFGSDGTVTLAAGSDDEITALAYAEDGTLFASGTIGDLGGAIYAYSESGDLQTLYGEDGAFDTGLGGEGTVALFYEDGALTQAFANYGRFLVVVARYLVTTDTDGDSVYDVADNCPEVSNVGQADADEDGVGNECEEPAEEPAEEPEERSPRRGSGRRHRAATETPVATTTAAVQPLAPAFARDLFVGDSGDDVRALQELLVARAAGPAAEALARVGATGYFGEYTRAALAELQRALGVSPAAGYFGPLTRAGMGL